MAAYSLLMNGDNNACAQWLNYAVVNLNGLLSRKTPTSLFLVPNPDVQIQIYTMPNKIIITVAGGVMVTLADQNSADGAYYQPAVWPFDSSGSGPSFINRNPSLELTPNQSPFQNEDGRLLITDISTQKNKTGFYAGGMPPYIYAAGDSSGTSGYYSFHNFFGRVGSYWYTGVRYWGTHAPTIPAQPWPRTLHQESTLDCGGHWYSGNKAVSWKGRSLVQGVIYPGDPITYNITGDYALYIGGLWCKLDLPKTMLIAGCAILPNSSELQATWPIAGTNGYKYLVGVLMYEGNVGLLSYSASTISAIYDGIVTYSYDSSRNREFYFLLLGALPGDTPDTFAVDLINGGNGDQVGVVSPDMALSYVSAFSAAGLCSGFASDGRTVAVANIDDNWYQTVNQYQFTLDYKEVGFTQLVSDVVQTVNVTQPGGPYTNNTFTTNTGVPPIIAIRAEDKGFIVCRNNFSYTGTSSSLTHIVTLDVATVDATNGYTVAYTLPPMQFDVPGMVVDVKIAYVRFFSVKFGACVYGYHKIYEELSFVKAKSEEYYHYDGTENTLYSTEGSGLAFGVIGELLAPGTYMAPNISNIPAGANSASALRFPGCFAQDNWAANDKVLVYCWSVPQWQGDPGVDDIAENLDGSHSGTLMLDITVGATHKDPVIYDYRIDRSLATGTAFDFYPLAVTSETF